MFKFLRSQPEVGNAYELDGLNNTICKIGSYVFPTASWEQKNEKKFKIKKDKR
jgi:hypothetical protein